MSDDPEIADDETEVPDQPLGVPDDLDPDDAPLPGLPEAEPPELRLNLKGRGPGTGHFVAFGNFLSGAGTDPFSVTGWEAVSSEGHGEQRSSSAAARRA